MCISKSKRALYSYWGQNVHQPLLYPAVKLLTLEIVVTYFSL